MGAGMRRVGLAGAASGELGDGVVQLRPEDAMVEAMLRGWRAQQAARGLRADTAGYRERLVRRFQAFTNEFPWQWRPADVDEWTLTLTAERHLAPATIRGYQTDLRLFSEYLTDARYGWAVACEEAFGTFPVPICHEWNTIAHLNDYEGSPEARPLSREELQRFLDYADDQVERAVKARRKGVLAAYRDATLFKVIYGWGLRRTETAKLDLLDWGRNPAAAEFGRYGMLHVRYGKAVRGQPPRRRHVSSARGWAGDAAAAGQPAMAQPGRGVQRRLQQRRHRQLLHRPDERHQRHQIRLQQRQAADHGHPADRQPAGGIFLHLRRVRPSPHGH